MAKINITLPEDVLDASMPSEFMPEHKKDHDWYLNMNRYFSTFYNPQANNFDYASAATDVTNSSPDSLNFLPRISDMMVNNFAYAVGQQPNVNYKYLEQDPSGRVYTNPWIKGRAAGMLMDFSHGSLMDKIEFLKFDAESRSKDVIASKEDLFSKIEMKFASRDVLAPFEQLGMKFKPYHKEFDRKGDIDKERKKFRDKIEKILIDIVNDINIREGMKMKIADGYLQSFCGLAAFYPYVVNGKTRVKVIPCYNTIWDNSVDDPFGDKMRFWGFVEYSTPAQIISTHPNLPDRAKVELAHIGSNNVENFTKFQSYHNAASTYNNGLKYWNTQNGRILIGVTKIFFIAPRDLRFKKLKGEGGNEYIAKMTGEKYKEEQGDYLMNAIHQCDNIGNRWCDNFGYVKNQLRDFNNKGNPTPNMFFFIPKMIMGTPHPPMEFLSKHQDEIDRLGHKVREITSRDYGKIPIINAAVMGQAGKQAISFADDLKNDGILVARTSAEFIQLTRDMKAAEILDLSANQSLLQYVQLKAQERTEMFQTIGKSEIALGQQKNYVSGEVQDTSSSLGDNVMKYHIDGYFECVRRLFQYCGNIQKMLIGTGKDRDGSLVVGTEGIKILKSLGERKFEDVLLSLKFINAVDENIQKIILQWGIAWANDPEKSGVLPQDMLALLKEKTIDGMISLLEDSIEKNKMEAQKMQQYKDMIAQLQQQNQIQAQQLMADKQEAGKNARHGKDTELKGQKMILDHAADLQGQQQQEAPAPQQQ